MTVLTVVGRASKQVDFERSLELALIPPFKIKFILPLTSDAEAKSYLAYVDSGSEEVDADQEGEVLASLGSFMFSVEVFDEPAEAVKFVNDNYQGQVYAPFMDPITSKEIFSHDILLALAGSGQVTMIRGLFDKQPVAVLAHTAAGHGDNDTLLTPMAIIVNEAIAEKLELPFKSSYDV